SWPAGARWRPRRPVADRLPHGQGPGELLPGLHVLPLVQVDRGQAVPNLTVPLRLWELVEDSSGCAPLSAPKETFAQSDARPAKLRAQPRPQRVHPAGEQLHVDRHLKFVFPMALVAPLPEPGTTGIYRPPVLRRESILGRQPAADQPRDV